MVKPDGSEMESDEIVVGVTAQSMKEAYYFIKRHQVDFAYLELILEENSFANYNKMDEVARRRAGSILRRLPTFVKKFICKNIHIKRMEIVHK